MASITIYSGINEELALETELPRSGCCCFWMPCMHSDRLTFSVGSNWWRGTTEEGKADGHGCWSKGLSPFKKIKEWSELVAFPKLKTFIRRFNKQRCRHGKFQYDAASYLLNFDEGPGHLADDDRPRRNFSMRYSSIMMVPAKPSVSFAEDRQAFT